MGILEALPSVRYLSFSGAASKGVMYIGALRALGRWGLDREQIRGCAGVSSGALVALLVCVNAEDSAVDAAFGEYNGRNLLETPDMASLINNFGLDNGQGLRDIVTTVLEMGGLSATTSFANLDRLTGRRFACFTTNLNTGKSVTWDAQSTPRAKVADAVVASMSIPFLFTPIALGGDLHVDGGVSCQLVTSYFPLDETLLVTTRPRFQKAVIDSWEHYARSIVQSLMWSQVSVCSRGQPQLITLDEPEMEIPVTKIRVDLITVGYNYAIWMLFPALRSAIEAAVRVLAVHIIAASCATEGTAQCNSGCAETERPLPAV